jgi:histidinol-phosphate/aromatic aminotransferase/cobyric acid decarboxylase-like protein
LPTEPISRSTRVSSGYPDGGVHQAIAQHHNLKPENILTGAGSGEILNAAGQAFLKDHKLVVGAAPTYGSVFSVASGIKKDAIRVPLLPDYRLDVPGIIKATHTHYRDVGFVYICNPNNPTGIIVTKQEIQQLLDGIPGDVPVLIDEAYHHYVNDPNYATSVPYVIEGRPVIVARTFSKIAALPACASAMRWRRVNSLNRCALTPRAAQARSPSGPLWRL